MTVATGAKMLQTQTLTIPYNRVDDKSQHQKNPTQKCQVTKLKKWSLDNTVFLKKKNQTVYCCCNNQPGLATRNEINFTDGEKKKHFLTSPET